MGKVEAPSWLSRQRVRESVRTSNYAGWGMYDSAIESYQKSFQGVLEGIDIISWTQSKNTLTVIDLMSSTEAIASIFESASWDKHRLGLAVSLEDARSDLQKERDKGLNVEKLDGDIVLPSTWKKIKKKLKGHRADLIMERAVGGIDTLPKDFGFYEFIISKTWEMLNENGMLLLQAPGFGRWGGFKISRWAKSLRRNNINVVFDHDNYAIKLVKTPDSPGKLPF